MLTPALVLPGTITLPDSVLTSASSFRLLPFGCVVAPFFERRAWAAAAIAFSRVVDPSEREWESSCAGRDFAGGMLVVGSLCYIEYLIARG